MMGTVAYCPPEQISRGSADARSDVYSAGVVLFELLTGAAPYVGDSAMAVAYQHVHSDVPAPSSRRPGIPPQLDEIVLRATCRDPAGRPLDAGAMLAELHDARIDLGLPVLGGAAPAARRRAPAQRHPADRRLHRRRRDATQRIARITATPPPPRRTARPPAVDLHPTTVQQPAVRARAASRRRPAGRSPAPAPSRRRRSRRRTALVVAIVLLLGLLTGYGAWYLAVGRYSRRCRRWPAQPGDRGERCCAAPASRSTRRSTRRYSETTAAGTGAGQPPGRRQPPAQRPQRPAGDLPRSRALRVPQVAGRDYAAAEQAFAGMPVRLVRRDTAGRHRQVRARPGDPHRPRAGRQGQAELGGDRLRLDRAADRDGARRGRQEPRTTPARP